jgi:hypothetical protein
MLPELAQVRLPRSVPHRIALKCVELLPRRVVYFAVVGDEATQSSAASTSRHIRRIMYARRSRRLRISRIVPSCAMPHPGGFVAVQQVTGRSACFFGTAARDLSRTLGPSFVLFLTPRTVAKCYPLAP